MKITSAVFIRGLKEDNDILYTKTPQIAFIGRSNAGKSSLINSLTGIKDLARTSNTPGRTQEINVFLVNNSVHFIDLPGYGFAKLSLKARKAQNDLIYWYLFESKSNPKVVLIIDAEIGPTPDDLEVLKMLEESGKEIVVVANKIDKIKKSYYFNHMKKIEELFAGHIMIPYSSKTRVGIKELTNELFGKK